MKKTLKAILLVLVMSMVLVLLTGCGGDKLVATKSTDDDMMGMGKYEEKIEVEFKDDKASKITMTYEFEKEESAKAMAAFFDLGASMEEEGLEGLKVEQKGKKLIIKMDVETFAAQEGVEESEMTKEAMKKSLEEDGYTVK